MVPDWRHRAVRQPMSSMTSTTTMLSPAPFTAMRAILPGAKPRRSATTPKASRPSASAKAMLTPLVRQKIMQARKRRKEMKRSMGRDLLSLVKLYSL